MYLLRARFNERAERPAGPLIAHAQKMKATKSKREIDFDKKLSIEEIQQEIKKHFKNNNGQIKGFGNILYYEFYENSHLLYKFDTEGNLIESTKFLDPEYKKEYYRIYGIVKKAVDEVDPFNIAWVDENEYEPEIKDLSDKLVGQKLTKKQIARKTRKVFEKWFWKKEENLPKYEEIGDRIFEEMGK